MTSFYTPHPLSFVHTMSPTTTPLPIPPIFAKYQQPTRSVRRRSTASGRTRSSEVSGSRDRLRALDALKRASAPRKFDPLGDEHEQAQAALYDLDHPLNKGLSLNPSPCSIFSPPLHRNYGGRCSSASTSTACEGSQGSPTSPSKNTNRLLGIGVAIVQ